MTWVIDAKQLDALFPFQIVTNLNLEVVRIGSSLGKICPSIAVGRRAQECFKIVRPVMKFELSVLLKRQRSLILIESIAEKIPLRGQYTIDETHGTVLFAVAPQLFEVQDLEKMGLTVHDFAPSDPVLDFLLVLKTKDTILEDALKLNESLAERQKSLEEARVELLAQVEERMHMEQAIQRANEDLTIRLETIVEQQRLIARMSVPVIHVWEGVVALPVAGILDEERIRRLSESILDTAARSDVAIIIVDLTGIEIAHDQAARKLVDIANAAKLLGRQCLFSGVNALLARALVESGVDMPNLTFLPNVRSAISRAIGAKRQL